MTARISHTAQVVISVDDDGETGLAAQYTQRDDRFRPGTIYVQYREDEGQWVRGTVEVSGPLIRSNGTLSPAVSRRRAYGGYTSTPLSTLPPHLLALVEANQPKPFAS